jgi:hypothetical protein
MENCFIGSVFCKCNYKLSESGEIVDTLIIIGIALIIFFLILPFINLVHELGHAIFALLHTSGYVAITLGAEKKAFSFRVGRLEISICRFFPLGGQTHYVEPVTYREHASIILGGPFFSLVLSIMVLIVFIMLPSKSFYCVTGMLTVLVVCLIQLIGAIVPGVYNQYPHYGLKSDGMQLKDLKTRYRYKNY